MKTQPFPPGSPVPHDPYEVFVVPDEEQKALEEGPRGPGEGPEEDPEFCWDQEMARWKMILDEDEKEAELEEMMLGDGQGAAEGEEEGGGG